MTDNTVTGSSDIMDNSKLPKHIYKDGAKWLMMPSKIILDGVLIWPECQNNLARVLHFLLVASYLFAFVGQIYNITDSTSNLASIAYTLLLFIVCVETTVRRLLCYFYREKLSRLLSKVYFEFWPSTFAGKELHRELTKYNLYLFYFTATYTLSAFMCGWQVIVKPMFIKQLPLATAYAFSWNESPCYEILYVWQSFMMIELVFTICGLDLFFVSLLSNCIAQLRLLKAFLLNSFEEIIQNTADDSDDNTRRTEVTKLLFLCIEKHNNLIRACKEIEEAFKYFNLVQYLTSMGTVCVSSFVVAVVQEDIGTAFTYLMGHICEILIYCYIGNELINESTELSDAVFHCGWHLLEYDKSVHKSLIMIMMRSQNPIRISVGGFGFLSLSSFFKLLQFSFSVYALLNSMMEKQKEVN